MNPSDLKNLLTTLRDGKISVDEGMARLQNLPFEDVGIAMIDHHRELRQGVPEVIFGEGKTPEQLLTILRKMDERGSNILITRVSLEKAETLLASVADGTYDETGRIFTLIRRPVERLGEGTVVVACAGTSDLSVAREAALTARALGAEVEEIVDAGVAGIHRLLSKASLLKKASVIIVVAGMEGALPSVVGGMVSVPVIAVPTSVGYGAAFGGIAALLGMLNSCASGVTVVNIDNGFGAAYAAIRILRTAVSR